MLTCTACRTDVDPLEVFPGPLCLPCYARSMEGTPLPTAADIVTMWGGVAR